MQDVERERSATATGIDSRLLVLLATVAVFLIYAASTWSRTVPLVAQDELGFISQSQLLAGVPPVNMGTAPYYHFGYSLLLVPVWWVTQDPLLAYKGFMLINAVLAALLVPLLVGIGAAFGFRRSPALVLAAVIVALWPSGFFVSHYAWSDALFRLVLAANVWTLARVASTPRIGWAVLFAATAVGLYAIHPKALLILLLAPVALIVLRASRVIDTRATIAALLVFGLLAAGTMLAMGYLHDALWHEGAYSAERTLVAKLLRPEALIGLAVVIGQIWYQLAASLGLAALGIWFVVRRLLQPATPAPRMVGAYVLGAVLAVAIASVIQMLDPVRVDHVAYGRYIDGASVVLLWLGLCWLLFGERGEGQRRAGLVSIAFVLLAGGLLAVLPMMGGLEPAIPDNVAGVGWIFRGNSTPPTLFGVSSLFLALVALILLVASRPVQMAVLALFVALSSAVVYWHEFQHAEVQQHFLAADAGAVRAANLTPLYWSDDARDHSFWSYHLQYVLATSFHDFDGVLPKGAGLISEEAVADGLTCATQLPRGLYLLANAADAKPGC